MPDHHEDTLAILDTELNELRGNPFESGGAASKDLRAAKSGDVEESGINDLWRRYQPISKSADVRSLGNTCIQNTFAWSAIDFDPQEARLGPSRRSAQGSLLSRTSPGVISAPLACPGNCLEIAAL